MIKKRGLAGILALILLMAAIPALGEVSLPGYSADTGYTYVTFGNYPQWIDGGDPQEMAWTWSRHKLLDNPPEVDSTPVLWRVLTGDEEQVFLLSEYVLFAMAMHPSMKEYVEIKGFFPETQLGKYLNTEFLADAFSPEEQGALRVHEDGTLVTLLTTDELNNRAWGLGKNTRNTARKAWATEYAIRVTDVFVYRVAMGMHTCYWLKDTAKKQKNHTRCVKQDGSIGHIACITVNEGARPAIHLDPSKVEIAGGSGTKTDPYQLRPVGK
ncbi:MAG: hypothetical protein IKE24_07845 [Clostridia bacterium]|nr:hypothetical protein [Clostridia bacterium]